MDGAKRLGREVSRARVRAGYSSADTFATHAKLGTRTIEAVEAGEKPRYGHSTYTKIDAALNWPDGTCEALMEGRTPEERADPLLARLRDRWAELTPDQQLMLVTLVEVLTRWVPDAVAGEAPER